MKTAALVLSALTLLAVAGCKPSGGIAATETLKTTPVQSDETPAPVMTDADASSAMSGLPQGAAETPAAEATCTDEIGKTAADKLVGRCIAVSPATHPPCNAENTCKMIRDEIDRSCAMYAAGEKKPAECAA